jgi:aminoglycoside phosphotransferase (APT) family kinase protein
MSSALSAPRKGHEIDSNKLFAYLKTAIPIGTTAVSLDIKQFDAGQSNPTYLLTLLNQGNKPVKKLVLRKKPPGKLLPSAHNVAREFKILSALNKTAFPVPKVYALCEDPQVVGTAFYLMEYVDGRILEDVQLQDLPVRLRLALFSFLMDCCV